MLCALFGVAVNQLFFFNGLNLSSSINASIIMTLNPLIVVVLSFFSIGRNDFPRIGLLVFYLAQQGPFYSLCLVQARGTELVLGDFFFSINAASYGVYLVLVKPLMAKYRPLTIITYAFTIGLIYVLLFPLTISELRTTDFTVLTLDNWMRVGYVVICVTFFAYLLTLFRTQKVVAFC